MNASQHWLFSPCNIMYCVLHFMYCSSPSYSCYFLTLLLVRGCGCGGVCRLRQNGQPCRNWSENCQRHKTVEAWSFNLRELAEGESWSWRCHIHWSKQWCRQGSRDWNILQNVFSIVSNSLMGDTFNRFAVFVLFLTPEHFSSFGWHYYCMVGLLRLLCLSDLLCMWL